ncbi:hypothetical protein OROHE_019632 [Orobanche hederae]
MELFASESSKFEGALLKLAKYHATSSPNINSSSDGTQSSSKLLLDRIELCYVSWNQSSLLMSLKVAYRPHGNFNLHDLEEALDSILDALLPESDDSGAIDRDVKYVLYPWEGDDKKVARKLISICSCLLADTLDSATLMNTLMDEARKNVSVEFIFLEGKSDHLGDITENINQLVVQIWSVENCSVVFSTSRVSYNIITRWFAELSDDREPSLE